jgi:hypothetical protein
MASANRRGLAGLFFLCDATVMRSRIVLQILLAALALPVHHVTAQQQVQRNVETKTCENLPHTSLPGGHITSAQAVAAGRFVQPGLKPDEKPPAVYAATPAFCRVTATLTPTPDSDIKIEVWMPLAGWNGKFRGQGNGGFAGYIDYKALASAVIDGDASGATDTGHATTDAAWALGHPEKIVDYGYRAIHEMTVQARSIVQAFYGSAPTRSYFASCSNGGRQALMEAQRFPSDYDGILAGAPANNWTPMLAAGLHAVQVLDGPGYIPGAKVPAIARAVVAACDAKDGVSDGVLNDPPQCHFDPQVMLCKGPDSDSCLTAPQVASLKAIYAGARDVSGHLIFPGFLPGAEAGRGGWATWVFGTEQGKSAGTFYVTGYFSNMVYDSPNWSYKTANVDAALKLANQKTGSAMNATDPNLKPFFDRGGKLIIYHGWNDPAISALNSIHYYQSVAETLGGNETGRSLRLYLVPGMQHCSGGPGATSFGQDESDIPRDTQHDIYAALVEWVEKASAPSTIISTHYAPADPATATAKVPDAARTADPPAVEMTRPLCVYPQIVKYSGTGDKNSAASFSCAAGPK